MNTYIIPFNISYFTIKAKCISINIMKSICLNSRVQIFSSKDFNSLKYFCRVKTILNENFNEIYLKIAVLLMILDGKVLY